MNERRKARRVYLTSKASHAELLKRLEHIHEHLIAQDRFALHLERRIKRMSAGMDRLTAEVAETKTAIDSALTLITGLAEQIRNLPANDAALNAFADELDAKQAEIAAAVTANTPADPVP